MDSLFIDPNTELGRGLVQYLSRMSERQPLGAQIAGDDFGMVSPKELSDIISSNWLRKDMYYTLSASSAAKLEKIISSPYLPPEARNAADSEVVKKALKREKLSFVKLVELIGAFMTIGQGIVGGISMLFPSSTDKSVKELVASAQGCAQVQEQILESEAVQTQLSEQALEELKKRGELDRELHELLVQIVSEAYSQSQGCSCSCAECSGDGAEASASASAAPSSSASSIEG